MEETCFNTSYVEVHPRQAVNKLQNNACFNTSYVEVHPKRLAYHWYG